MITFIASFIPGLGPFMVWAGRNKTLARVIDAAAAVLLVLLLLWFVHHQGVMGERHRWEAKAKAEAAALQVAKSKADALALSQKSTDAAAVAAQQEARTNAYASLPDGKPSAVRNALACQRLRIAHPGRLVPGCK
jgi:P pilus assembly chaperone PapD